MQRRVAPKWRPPLVFVMGGTLAAVMGLPLMGIVYIRMTTGPLGWVVASWAIFWSSVVATSIIAYLLWRLVLRPVQNLTAYARSVTHANIDSPELTQFGTPEFSELGRAMLQMSATLRTREAVVRTYADHVTHELKSPLTVIQGSVELLSDGDLPANERDKLLQRMDESSKRMTDLLDAQRKLARAQEPLPSGHCRLGVLAPHFDIKVLKDGLVPLSRDVLQLILGHLVNNARSHGATEVTVSWQVDRLVVADNGPGISAGNRDRVFDPFFTTRRNDGGTGMGLAIVRRLVEAQGAQIVLGESKEGQGAVFEILLG